MMKSEIFSFYDISYRVIEKNDKKLTQLLLFGKSKDGTKAVLINEDVKPYFLVELTHMDNLETFKKYMIDLFYQDFYFVDILPITKKSLKGVSNLVKIYVNIPKAVPYFVDFVRNSEYVKAVYEADIPFTERIMYDFDIALFKWYKINVKEFLDPRFRVKSYQTDLEMTYIEEAKLNQFRIVSFDIETYVKDKSKVLDFENPIVSISIYSFINNQPYYKVFSWKSIDLNNIVHLDKYFNSKSIVICDNEADMLNSFRKELIKLMPDFVVGYNSDNFDFPFIISRANKFNVDLDFALDFSNLFNHTKKENNRKGILIKGVAHIDLYRYVFNIMSKSLKSTKYSLKNVATELVGKTKSDFDPLTISYIWDHHDDEKLCEMLYYNYVDSKITYEVALIIITELIEFAQIVNLPITKISRSSSLVLLESLLFKASVKHNLLVPNKPSNYEVDQRKVLSVEGAFVKEPVVGKHKDIFIFDFQSLYPSIIISKNISPDTLNLDKNNDNKVLDKNIYFSKEKKGFMSEVVLDLVQRRAIVKRILKSKDLDDKVRMVLSSRSNILKLLANSIYGYLNYAYARWYCFDCADSITAYARFYIKKVISVALKYGFEIIYGDTDSVFLVGDKNKLDLFSDEVNNALQKPMYLDFQGHYPAGIFTGAKKRYALLDDDNDIIIKGFEFVRRNVSKIAKYIQYNTIELMLKKDEFVARDFVKSIISKLKGKDLSSFSKEDFAINVRISRNLDEYSTNAPHIVLAKKLNKKEKVKPGTIISYVVVKRSANVKNLNERVELINDVSIDDIDIDYYINNQILPAVERIFVIFGINGDELVGKTKQSSLSGFFN